MKITIDATKQKGILVCEDSNTFEYIRHHFSVENTAKSFVRDPVKSKYIPSRLYAITPTGLFDAGLVDEIKKYIASEQLASKVVTTPLFEELHNKCINAQVFDALQLQLRDYQHKAVSACLQHGRGTCLLATGAGKTLISASLACSLLSSNPHAKVLMLVPDPGLASQTYQDYLEYQVPFSTCMWTGKSGELDARAQIIVANHDIVISRLEQHAWLKKIDYIIVDEVHTIKKGNKITKIVQSFKTPHKFGFTGTLPVDQQDLWCVLGNIGKVLITKTSAELREQDVLTNVKVNAVNISYKNPPRLTSGGNKLSTHNYRKELEFIYSNEYRNNVIKQLCKNYNNNVLVLINHLSQGETLYNHLSQLTNKQVVYIQGATEIEQREEVKRLMERCNNVVCIAMSSIFSTGINVKNIHMIIFAAGGKSFIRVVQSIGRGLRKLPDKFLLTIIDIIDNLKYGIAHSLERQQTYETEKIKCFHTYLVEK